MKKIILLSTLLLTSLVFSQKFEISAGYGLPSGYGILNFLTTILPNSFLRVEGSDNVGVLNVSALVYSKDAKWRYGLDMVSEFYSFNRIEIRKQSAISVMPRIDYFWSEEDKKLRFYSGVSAGIYLATLKYNIAQEEVNYTIFGFNITPIGLRYGKTFAVFIEPNIGIKGLIQAGASYRF
ncbi:hypothetical protein D1631_05615 [Chryseobacterium nematophagum]|uniref:Outer membrane protein beta-barrel domain-containing protein n=1 Tax=Chryseobacterium nematophagum TaxID=2305228 RepID=A0A3M7TJM1_9FLAO|nr:hypothetical protein [Chryseobacterium nematophagum]RNA63753.1 hypothetical protein D1631_05615 [Chryseobacterium nematophagum]